MLILHDFVVMKVDADDEGAEKGGVGGDGVGMADERAWNLAGRIVCQHDDSWNQETGWFDGCDVPKPRRRHRGAWAPLL